MSNLDVLQPFIKFGILISSGWIEKPWILRVSSNGSQGKTSTNNLLFFFFFLVLVFLVPKQKNQKLTWMSYIHTINETSLCLLLDKKLLRIFNSMMFLKTNSHAYWSLLPDLPHYWHNVQMYEESNFIVKGTLTKLLRFVFIRLVSELQIINLAAAT